MALHIRLEFRDTPIPDLTEGVSIHRVELTQQISEAFDLKVELRAPNPQIDLEKAIGEVARVHFFRDENGTQAEPHLPVVEGMVRRARQLDAAEAGEMSTYELTIAHQLWMFSRWSVPAIEQQLSAVEIFASRITRRNERGPLKLPEAQVPEESTRVREYCVQYAESDYQFVRRILAEEGICFYFTGEGLTKPTLVTDTNAHRSSVGVSMAYKPAAGGLSGSEDAILAVEMGPQVETAGKKLRDYDFDNPRFRVQAIATADGQPATWGHSSYEEGLQHAFDKTAKKTTVLGQTERDAITQRRLEERRRMSWVAECRSTSPVPVGAVLTITGNHPLANTPLTVVRAESEWRAPREARDGNIQQEHRLTCTKASYPYRPELIPKSRIHGIQRAVVVGRQHIDVDEHGRVMLNFFWHSSGDNVTDPAAAQEQLTRRVSVSHGWAGASHGFVTLPRAGDEVLVAYVDGDPDQPVVVGRVYNGVNRGEVRLPDDHTQSLWRTQSSPSKDGFHEIRFEDATGKEELHIEAQRLHTRLVKGSESVNVQGMRRIEIGKDEDELIHENHTRHVEIDEAIIVDGTRTITIGVDRTEDIQGQHQHHVVGNERIAVDSLRMVTVGDDQLETISGALTIDVASDIGVFTGGDHTLVADGAADVYCATRTEETAGTHTVKAGMVDMKADGAIKGKAVVISLDAVSITLTAGGSFINVSPMGVAIKGPMVLIN